MRLMLLAAVAAVWSSSAGATGLGGGDVADPSSQFFNPSNGHIYEVVNQLATWQEAFAGASAKTLAGYQGHLVTVTSAEENQFVFNLLQSNVSVGWDGRSIWIAGSDRGEEGVWKWMAGPEAGLQFWQGASNGAGLSGTYNNMYAPYIQDENAACGNSGCISNPTGTGADFLFMYGGAYTPGFWDDAYSSITAVSNPMSPVASSEGLRNAYLIEYSEPVSATPSPTPEPSSWAIGVMGFGLLGAALRGRGSPRKHRAARG